MNETRGDPCLRTFARPSWGRGGNFVLEPRRQLGTRAQAEQVTSVSEALIKGVAGTGAVSRGGSLHSAPTIQHHGPGVSRAVLSD